MGSRAGAAAIPRAHRIELDVAHAREEIRLAVDDARPEPPLEEGAASCRQRRLTTRANLRADGAASAADSSPSACPVASRCTWLRHQDVRVQIAARRHSSASSRYLQEDDAVERRREKISRCDCCPRTTKCWGTPGRSMRGSRGMRRITRHGPARRTKTKGPPKRALVCENGTGSKTNLPPQTPPQVEQAAFRTSCRPCRWWRRRSLAVASAADAAGPRPFAMRAHRAGRGVAVVHLDVELLHELAEDARRADLVGAAHRVAG